MRNTRGLKPALTTFAALGAFGLAAAPHAAHAQASVKIDLNNVAPQVVLTDGTPVLLMESLASTPAQPKYRFLPLIPRLAKKADGTPLFLFASYNKSKKLNDTGVEQVGGLLNFVMTYGLDDKQMAELQTRIRNTDAKKGPIFKPNSLLDGAILMKSNTSAESAYITSATVDKDNTDLTRKVISTGKAPTVAGAQTAFAARLTGDGAQIFENTLKAQGAADMNVTFDLAFDYMLPAINAKITIDWSRLHANSDSYSSEFKDRLTSVDANAKGNYYGLFGGSAKVNVNKRSVSKQEVKAFYDFLREKQIVKFEAEQTTSDEVTQKYLDSFFNLFLEMVAKKENPPDPSASRQSLTPPDMSHLEKLEKSNAKAGDSGGIFGGVNVAVKVDTTQYRVRQYSVNSVNQSTKQEISLKISKAFRQSMPITGNLAQFYNQAKDNSKCVIRFYLDDPFFQKFDVPVVLGIDSADQFTSFANAVTVSIRKKRGGGNPDFFDSKTLQRNDFVSALPTVMFAYAGGDTADTSKNFEYQYQWNLKGGKKWPTNPVWKAAPITDISVVAPLSPKDIAVAGAGDAMTAKTIARVAVQIRYLQLGEEKEITVSMSPTQANDGITKSILSDVDVGSYTYRVTYYTTNGKKFTTDWDRDATGTIFIGVPDDILDKAL